MEKLAWLFVVAGPDAGEIRSSSGIWPLAASEDDENEAGKWIDAIVGSSFASSKSAQAFAFAGKKLAAVMSGPFSTATTNEDLLSAVVKLRHDAERVRWCGFCCCGDG